MLSLLFVGFVGFASAQFGVPCEYTGGPNNMYTLNLTSVNGHHLEYKSPDGHNYYHTPCWNGEPCRQGTANFQANTVQYRPGENQCTHYLSVDHHDRPFYFFGGAMWAFRYQDGEQCDMTQQPREANIYYVCDEFTTNTYLYEAYEPEACRYTLNVRSPLACVPVDQNNANCQWSYFDPSSQTTYKLDLSALNGSIIHDTVSENGYEHYYSPCQNGLHCYQQSGDYQVMSITANRVTHTCEHYLSVWQEGRVQPFFHNENPDDVHWNFHYWLNEKCSNGAQGEETIRWYCDPTVQNYTVINGSYDGNCQWEFNIASQYACPQNKLYTHLWGQKIDFSKL